MTEQERKALSEEWARVIKQFKLAQICRNQFAIDYAWGVVSNLKDDKRVYRHNIRRKVRQIEAFTERYNIAMNDYISRLAHTEGGTAIDEDIVRDAAFEYHRHIKSHIGYYENSVKRICGAMKIEQMQRVGSISTAKDIVAAVSTINGHEQNASRGELDGIAGLGGVSRMKITGQSEAASNTMGWLGTMLCSLLRDLLALEGKSVTEKYECDDDADMGRIMFQSTNTLTDELLWATYFRVLVEKGLTAEEAVEEARKEDYRALMRKKELDKIAR